MSDNALVVLNNQQQALQVGGLGMDSGLFKARPMHMEMVHKTTRQEGAQPGQFRVTATNEHLGATIRAVLLAVPQEQREWYENDGKNFSKDDKKCFSLDNKQPHEKAAAPPAMFCASCPMGDINWAKWRKTKDPKDLPPCSMYYHLFIAERTTQTPYYLNVKGTSVLPFRQAMEAQMAGLLAKLMTNAKMENKKRGYTYNPAIGQFMPTPGFVLPEGQAKQEAEPMPNIFDISFDIFITTKTQGGPFVMGFKNFALMKAEDRAEFGAMYLDFAQRKAQYQQQQLEETEAAEVVAEVSASAAPAAPAVVIPSTGAVTGEVVGKEEKITI